MTQDTIHIIPLTTTIPYFFINATASTEIYTLSLHDALPIYGRGHWYRVHDGALVRRRRARHQGAAQSPARSADRQRRRRDRKSTRLNSSHVSISYAVFCLKKKIKILLLRFYIL